MRKLKIAFLINNIEFLVSHRLPIAREAIKKGYEVYLIGPFVPVVKELEKEGFKYIELKMSRSGSNPWTEFKTLVNTYRVLKELRPDLIHLVTIKPIVYGGICSRVLNVPAVVSAVSGLGYAFLSNSPLSVIRRSIIKILYRFLFRHPNHQVVFQNQFDYDFFVRSKFIRSEQGVLIRGSGVDINQFKPTQEPTDQIRVLFASRFLYDKGILEFIQAAKVLKLEYPEVEFVLVGKSDEGNPASVSMETVESWVNSKVIQYWGHSDEMEKIFAQVNIVVLPSYREGLPKVLIEAAASQRAIVTTNVPGCSEVVRDGYNGFLVPAKDYEALADAIRKLIEDPNLRMQFAIASRKRAETEFFVEKVVDDTIAIYDKSLAA